jgi:two-component system response regulator ChvI
MDPNPDDNRPPAPLPSQGPGKDVVIFVVDDESMIGEVVEVILKLKGFRPRFFTDPELALQALIEEESKPDLLLTDFLMNPMNGMELIERCKRVQPTLKTILYSGNVGEEIIQYYSVKPDGFISKPFMPTTLVATVTSVLGR